MMNSFRMPVGQLWNAVMDRYLSELSGNQMKVVCYVLRHTIGFEKVEDAISLEQFLHGVARRGKGQLNRGVGLSKKTLLGVLRSLEQVGILRGTRRQMPGRGHVATVYSLALVAEREEARQALEPAPKLPQESGPKYTKPLGENLPQVQGCTVQGKNDHQATDSREAAPAQALSPPATPDDDSSQAVFNEKKPAAKETAGLSSELVELIDRMLKTGVSKSQTHRVLQHCPPQRIRECLDYLPYRNAKNPAGYFVREVMSGEAYNVPKQLEQRQLSVQREELKLANERAELERRRAQEAAYREQRDSALSRLSFDQKLALAQEARRRAKWVPDPEMLADGSPILNGMMLDLITEGWLETQVSTRLESKMDVPRPLGWSDRRRVGMMKEATA